MSETSLDCVWCDRTISGESHNTQDGEICHSCYEGSFECNDCGDRFPDDDGVYLTDTRETLCRNCYENSGSFRCGGCDEYYSDAHYDSDGFCVDCARDEEDDGRIAYRDIDLATREYQSENEGDIIKSQRAFGVELEMVNENVDNLRTLSRTLCNSVGVENDGSIKGGYGIEIQTPILKGAKGEELLRQIIDASKNCGFTVNKTCGTHCHLDAKEFLPTKSVRYQDWSGVPEKNGNMVAFVYQKWSKFHQHIMDNLARYPYDAFAIYGGEYTSKNFPMLKFRQNGELENPEILNSLPNSEKIRMIVEDMFIKLITQRDYSYTVDESNIKLSDGYKNLFIVLFDTNNAPPNSFVSECILDAVRNGFDGTCLGYYEFEHTKESDILKMKTLMAFYLIFDDIMLSMISPQRRGNMFCKPIKSRYALAEVLDVKSQHDFDKLWYRLKGERGTNGGRDYDEIAQRKRDGHDSTRYVGTNFHSLLGRNGTLEIRYHGGTLDANKILSWVSLHQTILDKVSRGEINLDEIVKTHLKLKFEEKLKDFFDILELPESLKAYVEGRIKVYNK